MNLVNVKALKSALFKKHQLCASYKKHLLLEPKNIFDKQKRFSHFKNIFRHFKNTFKRAISHCGYDQGIKYR